MTTGYGLSAAAIELYNLLIAFGWTPQTAYTFAQKYDLAYDVNGVVIDEDLARVIDDTITQLETQWTEKAREKGGLGTPEVPFTPTGWQVSGIAEKRVKLPGEVIEGEDGAFAIAETDIEERYLSEVTGKSVEELRQEFNSGYQPTQGGFTGAEAGKPYADREMWNAPPLKYDTWLDRYLGQEKGVYGFRLTKAEAAAWLLPAEKKQIGMWMSPEEYKEVGGVGFGLQTGGYFTEGGQFIESAPGGGGGKSEARMKAEREEKRIAEEKWKAMVQRLNPPEKITRI